MPTNESDLVRPIHLNPKDIDGSFKILEQELNKMRRAIQSASVIIPQRPPASEPVAGELLLDQGILWLGVDENGVVHYQQVYP
jgi:hypothetical protein